MEVTVTLVILAIATESGKHFAPGKKLYQMNSGL